VPSARVGGQRLLKRLPDRLVTALEQLQRLANIRGLRFRPLQSLPQRASRTLSVHALMQLLERLHEVDTLIQGDRLDNAVQRRVIREQLGEVRVQHACSLAGRGPVDVRVVQVVGPPSTGANATARRETATSTPHT
jgi:hypothetical protein